MNLDAPKTREQRQPLHEALVRRICAANPTASPFGFQRALAERLVDTGDAERLSEVLEWNGADVGAVHRGLRAECVPRIPDAWQMLHDFPHVALWEVAIHEDIDHAAEKWVPLAQVLDATGTVSISVIVVDRTGLCRVGFFEPFTGKQAVDVEGMTWTVDERCPVDWESAVNPSAKWIGGWRARFAERRRREAMLRRQKVSAFITGWHPEERV